MKYIGAHINTDLVIDSVMAAEKLKLNCVQIYIHNPLKQKEYRDKNLKNKTVEYIRNSNIKVFAHSSFTINIASNWDKHTWWINILIDSIKYCDSLDISGIVVHIGKQLTLSHEEAMNNMYTGLIYVLNTTKDCKVKLLLETPAGQGTEMCFTIEDLGYFYKKFSESSRYRDKVKICVDTCHLFASGYNISSETGIKEVFEKIDKHIGFNNVSLIHLNDSYYPLNSRIDRHENLGKGYIGKDGIKVLYSFFKDKVPIVTETPVVGLFDDVEFMMKI